MISPTKNETLIIPSVFVIMPGFQNTDLRLMADQYRVSKEIIGQSMSHDNTKTTDIYLDDIGDPVMDDLINSII